MTDRSLTAVQAALPGFDFPEATPPRSALPPAGTRGPLHATIETVFYSNPKFTAGLLRLDNGTTAKFSSRMFLRPAGPTVFEGEWIEDPKHGRQFSIQGVVKDTELTAEGLARYLSFLPVKGLGPSRAQLLVDAFGTDLPRALEDPSAVSEETGLPLALVTELAAIWKKNEAQNATSTWLAAAGLTARQTQTLIDRFGDSIQDILRDDPYSLIKVLKGFGFKRIDEMAVKTGTAPDDPARVSAAISYVVLAALEEEGHSWLREGELASRVSTLLGVESLQGIRDAIETASENDEVVLVQHREKTLVAHPRAYERETALISLFSRPVGKNPHFAGCDVPAFLADMGLLPKPERALPALAAPQGPSGVLGAQACPPGDALALATPSDEPSDEDDGFELSGLTDGLPESPTAGYLNADQQEAVLAATSSNIALISGGAGSGKTFTITALLRLYEAQGLKVELTAPTGRAAKRIEEVVGRPAQTLHRLLGSNGRTFLHEDQQRLAELREKDDSRSWDANVVDADVVIVDEVSMVDIDLAWHFFQSVDLDKTMVVLVGDHNQLPPVGPGSILRDLIARRPIPTVVLGTVVRQSGPLKDNSIAILNGEVRPSIPVAKEDQAQRFDFSPWIVKDAYENPEEARRFVLKLYRELLSERLGYDIVRDVQLLAPMKKGVLGTIELNRRLQVVIQKKLWNVTVKSDPEKDPPLLEHDRVIQVQNNYEIGVMNGTIGMVSFVDLESKRIGVTFDGETEPRIYERKFWHELQLAYALTVHKAQGAEFPCVISIIHQSHAHMHHRNLFYTAVTRARKTSILVGNQKAMVRCAKNTEAGRRNTFLSVLPMREARATRAVGRGEDGARAKAGNGAVGGAVAVKKEAVNAPGFLFDEED